MTTQVCAVLLAAGAGSRFTGRGHKLRAEVDGASVFARSLTSVLAGNIGPVVVVVGAENLADEVARVSDTTPAPHAAVSVVTNPRWAEGMATSLRAGIDAAAALGADTVVVGLADQPGVEPDAWRRLADSACDLAVATYDGVRGHPVRIGKRWWAQISEVGDEGARALLRREAEIVCEVACRGTPTDVDTADDLARINGQLVADRHRARHQSKE
ncbi:MAG: nucleotidyltransferase family protein [Ilumatobacteraceae bacterium]|jgi:molybdenum cofactor cytidylyltransferase